MQAWGDFRARDCERLQDQQQDNPLLLPGPCRQINAHAWYAVRYGGPKNLSHRGCGVPGPRNLKDAAMTAEQAKDFHKTAEAMFEYGMSIASEIAGVFNVVKPYGENREI